MAGTYVDVPGPRLAYDIDGTFAIQYTVGTFTPTLLTSAQKSILNDESRASYIAVNGQGIAFVFPVATSIVGYVNDAVSERQLFASIFYSTNTTNGIDGTWTQISGVTSGQSNAPFYRSNITTLGTPIVAKGLRFHYASTYNFDFLGLYGLHIYGTPVTNTRLDFWHPTLDQALTGAYFDFGDVAQGTSTIKEFRLKNFSTSGAGNVSISIDVPTETSPTIASQHSLSLNGTTWFSYLELPETSNIAIPSVNNSPNNFSPIIYFRRNSLSNATVGLYAGRIIINVGEWI